MYQLTRNLVIYASHSSVQTLKMEDAWSSWREMNTEFCWGSLLSVATRKGQDPGAYGMRCQREKWMKLSLDCPLRLGTTSAEPLVSTSRETIIQLLLSNSRFLCFRNFVILFPAPIVLIWWYVRLHDPGNDSSRSFWIWYDKYLVFWRRKISILVSVYNPTHHLWLIRKKWSS
jgi:hypothetical protein